MELIIKNYKNIDELDLKLDERKINFIYGMSGSGKSSIAGAMNGEIKENVVSYGKNIDDTLVDLKSEEYLIKKEIIDNTTSLEYEVH